MIDFKLTEEQEAYITMTREFVERYVKPISAERDRRTDPIECFPWEVVDEASRIGLRTLPLPKEYGGPGVESLTLALLVEELARGDLGVSVIFAQTWKFVQMIHDFATQFGTLDLSRHFLAQFRDDPRYLIGAGLTEPEGGGSDNLLPCPDPKAGAKLTAIVDGDEVVLNGMKHFISLGATAKLFIILARTDRTKPVNQGTTAFLVPTGTPGFRFGRVHDKIGERLVTNAELIFENCRIPKWYQLTAWNEALVALARVLRQSNAYAAASVLGVARAAYEKALDWARNRVQGATQIINHPNIAIKLAEMWMLIEVAHTFIMRAAWLADRPELWDPKFSRAPKVFASQVATRVALAALEIHGGYGIMKEIGVEKLVRDALVFLHSDGTNDILLLGLTNLFLKSA
jgi:alkylation response protein AidB-like acyl-CoA dehydrogenase